ncbi:MAG: D-alanyl-D-alanine carboxypeptidase [Ignavibacterium sp.]|nr:D-alanyl-D-alanine carboxypeptidase [Ignavibacterium sp.]MDW8376366.1 D-alanyl-D-alanine carboxypeptidase [Ignavibacteriales bacterium]
MRYFFTVIVLLTFTIFGNNKQYLEIKIKNIISKAPSDTKAAILIYNPLNQDTIYKQNIWEQMVPASVTKLFTTAVALQLLGKDFKVKTKLLTDDFNIKDGIINGNIYLKGFGNPIFSRFDLENFAQRLVDLGIKKIEGDVIGDESYFDNIYQREDWIEEEKANVPLPPISALILDRNKKTVVKKIKNKSRYSQVNFKNPALEIAEILREILIGKKIYVNGVAKSGLTPTNHIELDESHIKLDELIAYINKNSDNFYAECLFKILGAEFSKSQGTYFFSQQAIKDFLKKNDIPSFATEIVDGSGISRFDKVTAASVSSLLERMYFDLVNFESFYNSLSIAGIDGTLRNRMNGRINFRGKTGTLNGVIGLAGYLRAENEDDLIVTILFEYRKGSYNLYRKLQDEIIEELNEWIKSYSAN